MRTRTDSASLFILEKLVYLVFIAKQHFRIHDNRMYPIDLPLWKI